METPVIIGLVLFSGAAYYWYTKSKDNKIQKVMLSKHDVPKIRQRVNDVLNEAQSRHNIQRTLQHNLTGIIKDRYIRPFKK